MIYLIPILFLIYFIFQKQPLNFSFDNIFLFILALIFATVLTFVFDFVIGLGAFWVQDVKTITDFHDIFYFVLSGKVIPLGVLPTAIQIVNDFLPFRYMLSFPAEIILGNLNLENIILGFCVQIFWIILMTFLYIFMWRKGLKRYSAYGA